MTPKAAVWHFVRMSLTAPSAEFPIQVSALYKFATFPDYTDHRQTLLEAAEQRGIVGSLLLAEEGINGTIAGMPEAVEAFLQVLQSDERFRMLELKHSFAAGLPFRRMKVRLKKEIVTLGQPAANPQKVVGTYVEPSDWNTLVADPSVTLIDTRNHYETEVGSFRGAMDPQTHDFREFPEYVEKTLNPDTHPRVAMYCTGGIRCEKASSLLLQRGFKEVYHLKGGILNYLEKVAPDESLWEGECFVFDRRVTVDHALRPGRYTLCDGCDRPLSPEDRASPYYREGIHCAACHQTLAPEKRARLEERQRQRQQVSQTADSDSI